MGKKKKKKQATEQDGQAQAQATTQDSQAQGQAQQPSADGAAEKPAKKKKKARKPRKPDFYTTLYPSVELGPLTLASDGENLVGLWLPGQKYFGATLEGKVAEDDSLPVFAQVKEWLDRYFAGEQPSIFALPLAPIGTDFRHRVWRKLITIPYGQTRTYGQLAEELAAEDGTEKLSAQAVGGAVGHNPISIIIPCHRVVGAGGSLTGYAGGVDKKVFLLEHEGADMSGLSVPKKGTAL